MNQKQIPSKYKPWNVRRTPSGWTATEPTHEADLGTFNTITEVLEYIDYYEASQEYQNAVADELDKLGAKAAADEFRNASTDYAMTYRDTHANPKKAALSILQE